MLLLLALFACGPGDTDPPAPAVPIAPTDLGNYPALAPAEATWRPGVQGLVKLLAEHQVHGVSTAGLVSGSGPVSASYVIQGAGTLLVDGDRLYVLTAAHVTLPSPRTEEVVQSDGTIVRFSQVTERSSRVRLGSLDVRPVALWLDPERDLALLEFPMDKSVDVQRSLSRDPAAPIPLRPAAQPGGGRDVEAWGYPAQVHPQVAKPAISASTPAVVVLNEALPGGYSGGPVMVAVPEGKRMVAVISRADEGNRQTSAIPWAHAASLLSRAQAGTLPAVGLSAEGVFRVQGPAQAAP